MDVGDSVKILKLDHQGNEVTSYSGSIAHADAALIVAACSWDWEQTVNVGPFDLVPGDRLCEFYYRDAWFNVFRVSDEMGRLKGWYCNVTEPPEFGPDQIAWRDLKLDLVISADGRMVVADEDEFADMDPSPKIRERASDAMATLRSWHREHVAAFAGDGLCADVGAYTS